MSEELKEWTHMWGAKVKNISCIMIILISLIRILGKIEK